MGAACRRQAVRGVRRDGTRFRKKHGITGRRHRIGSGDTRMRVTLRVRIRGERR
ncbi:hypothetical protein [Megasphaera lornae]|uniref:50S ribosomal protein L34 n=1 Tax=Megasphaera lornae TaxID=1000568 RepID=A0ABN0D4V8_9FIRM|nr:hypothetical protein [Megasphaera lornae]EGL42371.1 hypothetical protein HMPREF1039_0826 [Megasphaera lornae]